MPNAAYLGVKFTMCKFVVLAFMFIVQPTLADDFDVTQFMTNKGLTLFDLDKMPQRQRFTNHRHVTVDSGGLSLADDWQNTNQRSLKIGNLEYIGSDNGEWGGELYVLVNDQKRELLKGNIVHLLPLDGKLYVIEGLAHLSMAGGSISVIEDITSPTIPKLITRLPDAPRLVYLDSSRPDFQRIVIVGTKSVISIDSYMSISILYWDAFWHINLDPTSIVRFENNYFIGLPHGVAVIPAPWGESSRYCQEYPGATENHCRKVRFFADEEFNKSLNTGAIDAGAG